MLKDTPKRIQDTYELVANLLVAMTVNRTFNL